MDRRDIVALVNAILCSGCPREAVEELGTAIIETWDAAGPAVRGPR